MCYNCIVLSCTEMKCNEVTVYYGETGGKLLLSAIIITTLCSTMLILSYVVCLT